MDVLDVRRLAAVDMHGVAGTSRRRRLIRAEFLLGGAGCVALGAWAAAAAASPGWRVAGAWVVGVGVNYAALAWQAALLSRPGALEAELAGVDIHSEIRRYSYLQFWVVVPLALAALAALAALPRKRPPTSDRAAGGSSVTPDTTDSGYH
jgi:hypothetical protein